MKVSYLLALCALSAAASMPSSAHHSPASSGLAAAPAAACPAPTLQRLWAANAVRAHLLSARTDGLELVLLPHVRSGAGRLSGHWAHISESGPLNGTLAWIPCDQGVRSSARQHRQPAALAIPSGSFVAWHSLPARGRLPPRLVLTHRRTGTGLESHQTEVVAVVDGRLRVLLQAVTWERAALKKLHETIATLAGLQMGTRVTIRTVVTADGESTGRRIRHRCWLPDRSVYGPCR